MSISGFTFIHNAIAAGIPVFEAIIAVKPYVDEIVVVDMESDDGTTELLHKFGCKVIDGKWGSLAGKTLSDAHALHEKCSGDTIVHFEADEVFDDKLIREVRKTINQGESQILVPRIQLEQNFQKMRWGPIWVHRVFKKGTVQKYGESTVQHKSGAVYPKLNFGYLWDITNNFRNNWIRRLEQQAELWNLSDALTEFQAVPLHSFDCKAMTITASNREDFFNQHHWWSTQSPYNIPLSLRKWMGITEYDPMKFYARMHGPYNDR